MTFKPKDAAKAPVVMKAYEFKAPGVLMGMYNTDASITSFAEACF